MSEVISQVADVPAGQIAVVSGPNLAREIAQRQYAATVVACPDGQPPGSCRPPATPATSARTRTRT
jgi:Glycerol-3-phosphate dehydrogenase